MNPPTNHASDAARADGSASDSGRSPRPVAPHPAFHVPAGFEDDLDRELAAMQREYDGPDGPPAFATAEDAAEAMSDGEGRFGYFEATATQYRDASHAFASGGGALDLVRRACEDYKRGDSIFKE